MPWLTWTASQSLTTPLIWSVKSSHNNYYPVCLVLFNAHHDNSKQPLPRDLHSIVCFIFKIPEVPDAELARALHWGGSDDKDPVSTTATAAVTTTGNGLPEVLVELGTQQVVASERACLVLTSEGVVHSIDSSKGDSITTTVREMGEGGDGEGLQ